MVLTATDYRKKSMRKRRNVDRKHKNHLKALWAANNEYPASVMPMDKTRHHTEIPENITHYERYYRANHARTSCNRYFKKYSNKVVRRYNKGISGKTGYKKVFDLWWTIY